MAQPRCTHHILCNHRILPEDEVHELQSKAYALETELESIEGEIGMIELGMGDMEVEMGTIEKRLAVWEERRRAIGASLDVQRALLAPIRSLPSEILADIFLWTMQGIDRDVGFPDWTNDDQLHILLVCKEWRGVALGLPALWSRLMVKLDRPLTKSEGSALGTWLTRSGACTIHLHVNDNFRRYCYSTNRSDTPTRIDADWVQSMEMIVKEVLRHVGRCSNLSLHLPSHYVNRILSSQANGLSRLERLSVHICESTYGDPLLIDFSIYTRLRTLCCSTQHLAIFRGEGVGVRELRTEMPLRQTMDLLNLCPLITKSSCFDLSESESDSFSDHEPVLQLSHLTELTLGLQPDSVGLTLDRLSLPSLQVLTLQASHRVGSRTWPHLAQLLQRSRPPLRTLILDSSYLSETSLIQVLSHAPVLKSLIMSGGFLTKRLWHALTVSDTTDTDNQTQARSVCLELTTIEFRFCRVSPGLVPAIAAMVLSRCPLINDNKSSRSHLQVLRLEEVLEECDSEEFLCYPGVRDCIKGGLYVNVKHW